MQTHKRAGFIILMLLMVAQHAVSQYMFRHLDITTGLSDNQIRGITMMPDKRLAVKTASTFNVYDGAMFRQFYQDKWQEYRWDYFKTPKQYYDHQGRIWMKEQDHLLLLDLNTNRFVYDIDRELAALGVTDRLINLFIDHDKNYWFVTESKDLLRYDIKKRALQTITPGNSEFTLRHGIPREMTQYKNFYWIIYSDGLIQCWDATSEEFVTQDHTFLSIIDDTADKIYINISDKDRIYMHTTPQGNLWLMLPNDIYHYDRISTRWNRADSISGLSNFYTTMDLDQEGNVWVGTSRAGLRFIHKNTHEVEKIAGIRLDTGGTIYNDIYSVFVDENNGLWVGTLFQGLCYYHPNMKKFRLHHVLENQSNITNEVVYNFLEQPDGNILIATGKGLFSYNPATATTEQIYKRELDGKICTSLYRDSRNRIWVSTFFDGFFCIANGSVRNYKTHGLDLNSFPNPNNARAIYEDADGNFWVSVMGGVGRFDTQTGKIDYLYEHHPKINNHKVDYAIQSTAPDSFAVLGESGIYYYNTRTDSLWVPELDDPRNPKYQGRGLKYYCMFKDSRGLEWFGTEYGLRAWDEEHQTPYMLNATNGLLNNFFFAILEDAEGILWVSTVNGISKIEVKKDHNRYTFHPINFNTQDGLQSGAFNARAALKATDGTFYFGGVHGFNSFNPEQITFNTGNNKPLFTALSLFNTPINEGTPYNGRVIMHTPINKAHTLKLKHNENFISLEFAGLNYVDPSRTYFRYKLEGFDTNWTETVTSGQGKVTYTGLPPGKYKLVIYTANNDKIWGDTPATMSIIIGSPFWVTPWAILIYIILLLAATTYVVHYLNRRSRRKMAEQQVINQRRQKEELDQMKFRFFTNVSHEFRTPLTLILMPLETLIKQQTTDAALKEKLTSIYSNARDLLTLVNQLLDFRKLEMKGEELKPTRVNIEAFLQNIYAHFKDTVMAKGIDFILEAETGNLSMMMDEGKMQKVMNNLLSNALKHTPEGGNISIIAHTVKQNHETLLKLSIADSGQGIPGKDLNKIFDRFYQAHNRTHQLTGSGIGLHLTKEYVLLHNGQISVENRPEGGAVFTLLLPTLLQGNEQPDASATPVPPYDLTNDPMEEPAPSQSTTQTLLLVEDNAEFRRFLIEQLAPLFTIIEAADGEEGERLALLKSPDLIVTDLMMPKVDGITLCKRLKTNIQTSHIPIILLTARTSDEAKIEGYEAGADSYISKPFSFEVLLTRIKKLIEQRESRKELFHKAIEVTPSSITITSLDEELVQKALKCVEENMDNPEYSVENLSRDVGLSRVHLYRKLQSITGQSPGEFIRSIRLKRAAQYLSDSRYNIMEIADLVGFNTIKYFNKHFKEEFGVTPTQYRAEREKEGEGE